MATTSINLPLTTPLKNQPSMPELTEEEEAKVRALLDGDGPWFPSLILRAVKKALPQLRDQVNARIKVYDQRIKQAQKDIDRGGALPRSAMAIKEAKIALPEVKTLSGIVKSKVKGIPLITTADSVRTPLNVVVRLEPNSNLPAVVQDPIDAEPSPVVRRAAYRPQTAVANAMTEVAALVPSVPLPQVTQDPVAAPPTKVSYTARNAVSSAMASADAAMGGGGGGRAGGAVEEEEVSSSDEEDRTKRTNARKDAVKVKIDARKAALVAENALQALNGPQLRALYASLTSAPVTPFYTRGKLIAEIERLQGK